MSFTQTQNQECSPDRIGISLAEWLLTHRDGHGRVLDPRHQEHGSYANGFAALTFGLMHAREGESRWAQACEQSSRLARARPRTSEFDQLALLLLARLLGRSAEVEVYQGRKLVSNNWVAMRALNFSLRWQLLRRREDETKAGRLWKRVEDWQMPGGCFADSPGGDACPVTYHAKFCAMLAMLQEMVPELVTDSLRAAFRTGVEALACLVSPGGVLVPYGRSRHTLFGYAAACYALAWAARHLDPGWAGPARRLCARLQAFLQPDGHIPCLLGAGEGDRRNWDVYINNPDYNAYAAALLLLAPALPAAGAERVERQLFRGGGLAVWRLGEWFAAFAAEGASVPLGTPFFCDSRYYGMQPLWIERQGQCLFEPPDYRWGSRAQLVDPTAHPWCPYVEAGDGIYCARVYRSVSLRAQGESFAMEGIGTLECYSSVPRWRRAVGVLTGRPAVMYSIKRLNGASVHRRVEWEPGRLASTSDWTGTAPHTIRNGNQCLSLLT